MDTNDITQTILILIDTMGFDYVVDDAIPLKELDIQKDLGLDSLDFIELIVEVEKEYGIQIYDEEIQGLRTLGDFIQVIEDNL